MEANGVSRARHEGRKSADLSWPALLLQPPAQAIAKLLYKSGESTKNCSLQSCSMSGSPRGLTFRTLSLALKA